MTISKLHEVNAFFAGSVITYVIEIFLVTVVMKSFAVILFLQ